MKITPLTLAAGSVFVLAALELTPLTVLHTGFVGEAQAIVGRPVTPVSVAGVARRTTRRAVVAGSAVAVGSAAAVATTQAAPQPAAPPPPAPPAGGPLPVGTVVTALPAGCVMAPIRNVEYYLCNGTYFRAGFQGNNLVYVVEKP